jgi:hypothetical protein
MMEWNMWQKIIEHGDNMIKAQEAYQQSIQHIQDVDIIDWFIKTENLIKEAAQQGAFAIEVQPIEDLKVAEKIAIQLESEYGYYTVVLPSGIPIIKEGKMYKQGHMIHINWKNMPSNTRDKFTV